jgi:divinyl protochlorophyllide a 8-vinyl-reductase
MGTVTNITERTGGRTATPPLPPAKIGPNAVIQLVAAIREAGLDRQLAPIFASCDATHWLYHPPGTMLDARRVGRLFRAVRAALPPLRSAALMEDAGRRTADYLLAARIPGPVQLILKILPARIAATILVYAIRRHAWTFAGNGRFTAKAGSPTVCEIVQNPLCAGETSIHPICNWHVAVFQRLFEVLVSPSTRVEETECEAKGNDHCRFVIDWRDVRVPAAHPAREPHWARF